MTALHRREASTWRALLSLGTAAALIAPQQRRTRARLHAESKYWSYDGVDVHYAIEQSTKPSDAVVVFGPGFGAGAFQFADVCRHVADGGVDAIAMDWLGQGKSWPEGDMTGRNFGVETWIAQLTAFVEQLDYSQVYVAGNSIGGLVAASVAARSDCVKGCALLNPTPFWSFWDTNGCPLWNGDLPGPAPFEAFGAAWFDALRDEKTVQSCVEINQSFLSDDAAVLAPSSGEEPTPPRHRAGGASIGVEVDEGRAVSLISTQARTRGA